MALDTCEGSSGSVGSVSAEASSVSERAEWPAPVCQDPTLTISGQFDGVLAEPDVTWLGLVPDKVAAFTAPPFCVPADALPHTTVGGVVRPLPDAFPIGLAPDGSCLFLFLITTPLPTTFRTFLTRHVALLSALRASRLRLLIPPALSDARDAYMRAVHQVLESVVTDDVETHVELVPVTHAYLRLERLVGTA